MLQWINDRPVLKFAGLFLTAYFILALLTQLPGLGNALNASYRGLSKSSLSLVLPQLEINTKPSTENGRRDDNTMIVEFEWTEKKVQEAIAEARRTRQANLEVPYRFISYLLFEFFTVPLIFLVSLIIATPMLWRPKLKWGGIALGVMLIFLLIKLYLLTLFSVSKAQIDVYELSHNTMSFLQTLAGLMTMGFSIIIAFFIYLILVFRKSSLKTLINQWFAQLAN